MAKISKLPSGEVILNVDHSVGRFGAIEWLMCSSCNFY